MPARDAGSHPIIRYLAMAATSYTQAPNASRRAPGTSASGRFPAVRRRAGMQVTTKPTASNAAHARRVCMGEVITATRSTPRGRRTARAPTASSRVERPPGTRIHSIPPPRRPMMRAWSTTLDNTPAGKRPEVVVVTSTGARPARTSSSPAIR